MEMSCQLHVPALFITPGTNWKESSVDRGTAINSRNRTVVAQHVSWLVIIPYEGVTESFRTESITKYTLTTITTL